MLGPLHAQRSVARRSRAMDGRRASRAAARAVYNQSLSGDTQRHCSCSAKRMRVSQAARVESSKRRDVIFIPRAPFLACSHGRLC
jgi:hypothetical protein